MSVTRDATGSMLRAECFMGTILYQASIGLYLNTGTVQSPDSDEGAVKLHV